MDFDQIKDKLDYLTEHFRDESEKIEKHLCDIQKINVLDYLKFD